MTKFFKKSLLSPVFVIVFVTMLMFLANVIALDQPWEWGHSVYLLGVLSFVIAYMIAYVSLTLTDLISPKVAANTPYRIVIRFYWVLSSLGLLLSLYKIYSVGMGNPYGSVLLALRIANTWEHQTSYGAQHFALFALCLALYYAQKKRALPCLVASLIYLTSAFSMAERTSMMFLFVAVGYTAINEGWIKLKGLLFALAILISLFIIVAIGTGKTGGDKGYDFILLYLGYAVTAFSQWTEGKEYLGCADLVFGKFADLMSLGLYSCDPLDLGLTEKDFNVLTYAASPYLFGGLPAVLASMAVMGAFFATLRALAIKRKGYYLALLSCYMYSLIMMFYAWQFSLTTYLYLMIILFPLFAGRFLHANRLGLAPQV
jgi:oligosaccharide repeat unit polymerase